MQFCRGRDTSGSAGRTSITTDLCGLSLRSRCVVYRVRVRELRDTGEKGPLRALHSSLALTDTNQQVHRTEHQKHTHRDRALKERAAVGL